MKDKDVEELVLYVLEKLPAEQEEKTKKKIRPTRIRWNGKYLKVISGKSLWNQPGHAKNALTRSVEFHLSCHPKYPRGSWSESRRVFLEVKKKVLAAVEFVPVE